MRPLTTIQTRIVSRDDWGQTRYGTDKMELVLAKESVERLAELLKVVSQHETPPPAGRVVGPYMESARSSAPHVSNNTPSRRCVGIERPTRPDQHQRRQRRLRPNSTFGHPS